MVLDKEEKIDLMRYHNSYASETTMVTFHSLPDI
jgi:hypothetical protein